MTKKIDPRRITCLSHPNRPGSLLAALALLACFFAACALPFANETAGPAAHSRNLTGPNGSVSVTGMTGTSLTVSFTPATTIASARLYVTEGNGNGLVLASQAMVNSNGIWSWTFSHPSFTSGARIGLAVLQNVNGAESCVPQGILGDSTTWSHFTYGSDPNSFTVSFDSQGATTPASPASKTVVKPATTIDLLPSPPVRTGYTFKGWYTAANGGGSEFTATTPVSADRTVFASWEYTGGDGVELSGPNGTIYLKDMANGSVSVSYAPAAPVSTARLFLSQGNGTGLVLANQLMTNNGGTWSWTFNHSSYKDNAKIYVTVLANGASGEKCVPQGLLADTTSWASFAYGVIPHRYTVSFDSQGADVPASPAGKTVSAPATTVDALPSAPLKDGYRFAGWFTQPNGAGTRFTATTAVNASLTVYACWVVPVYRTVTFNGNGATSGPVPATKQVMTGDPLGALPVVQKADMSLLGWFTAATGGDEVTEATVVTQDATYHARWSPSEDNLLPLVSGMHMTMQFKNNTNGAWRDDQLYITMLVRNRAGDWCWVKPDGTQQPMSLADNGQLTKNGRQCANYSLRLSDMAGFQLPTYVDSGRVFVSAGSPLYLTVNIDGNGRTAYAAPDLNNTTDPNADVYFDWYEFAIVNAWWAAGNPVGFWGNTTQVDQLSIPLMARVYDKNGTAGGTLIGRNGISESRAAIWQAWDNEVPQEFRALKGTYRINAPCKDKNGFGLGSPHASYYDSYVNQIWDQYRTQTLSFRMDWNGTNHLYTGRVQGDAFVFQEDGQGSIVAVARKPTATEIFEASGVLATGNTREGALQARIAAAFNRHVMQDSSLWDSPAAFYQAVPANYYSKFMHDHSFGGGAYGFAYDDVGNFSGALWSYNARAVVIDINW